MKALRFVSCLLVASTLSAKNTHKPLMVTVNVPNLYLIMGPMDVRALAPMADALSAETNKEVHIVISSPGGHVAAADILTTAIDGLKARGVIVNCYVGGAAASAAFDVLMSCSTRHVSERSMLLFHPPSFGGLKRVTIHDAGDIVEDLTRMYNTWLERLTESLPMSPENIKHHYNRETFFIARELDALLTDPEWMTIHSSISFASTVPGAVATPVSIPMNYRALASAEGEVTEGACYVTPVVKGTTMYTKVIQITGKVALIEGFIGSLKIDERIVPLSDLEKVLSSGGSTLDADCAEYTKRSKQG